MSVMLSLCRCPFVFVIHEIWNKKVKWSHFKLTSFLNVKFSKVFEAIWHKTISELPCNTCSMNPVRHHFRIRSKYFLDQIKNKSGYIFLLPCPLPPIVHTRFNLSQMPLGFGSLFIDFFFLKLNTWCWVRGTVVWKHGEDHPSATPRVPAHHAPCASARLGLEPNCDHGGTHALQCEHNHRHMWDPFWCAVTLVCVMRWRTRCELGVRKHRMLLQLIDVVSKRQLFHVLCNLWIRSGLCLPCLCSVWRSWWAEIGLGFRMILRNIWTLAMDSPLSRQGAVFTLRLSFYCSTQLDKHPLFLSQTNFQFSWTNESQEIHFLGLFSWAVFFLWCRRNQWCQNNVRFKPWAVVVDWRRHAEEWTFAWAQHNFRNTCLVNSKYGWRVAPFVRSTASVVPVVSNEKVVRFPLTKCLTTPAKNIIAGNRSRWPSWRYILTHSSGWNSPLNGDSSHPD